jgi:hypothetical protein
MGVVATNTMTRQASWPWYPQLTKNDIAYLASRQHSAPQNLIAHPAHKLINSPRQTA